MADPICNFCCHHQVGILGYIKDDMGFLPICHGCLSSEYPKIKSHKFMDAPKMSANIHSFDKCDNGCSERGSGNYLSPTGFLCWPESNFRGFRCKQCVTAFENQWRIQGSIYYAFAGKIATHLPNKCNCPMTTLMSTGCKCGGK